MEITIQTLKGIHNFRKGHTMKQSTHSPWGFASQTLPIIEKEDEKLYGGVTEHYESFLTNPKISQ